MQPQTPVAGVGQRFGECPSKLRTEGVIWLLLQRCGHSVRPATCWLSRSCSVDAFNVGLPELPSGQPRIASRAPCESRSPWLHAAPDTGCRCWSTLWRVPKQAPHRRCDLAAAAEMRAFGEASYMLAEPQLLSRCFQCRVARVTERTAKDSESGTLKIHVALAPCSPRHRLPVLVSALASAQASSAQKV